MQNSLHRECLRAISLALAICVFASLKAAAQQHPEQGGPEDSKIEIVAQAWLQTPKGVIHGGNGNLSIDLQRDLHFKRQYNFLGIFNWRFARKHHLIFETNPSSAERTTTLDRTITFRGETFSAGANTRTQIKTFHYYPQYQYNIILRRRGHLGLNFGVDLFHISADLSAVATTTGPGGAQTVTRTASGSLFAGLPTGGLEGRIFPIPGHDWLNINGHIRGMYFFGYGKYLETRLNTEVRLGAHLGAQGGYQFMRETEVHNKPSDVNANRFGFALKYSGPLVGATFRW